MPTPNWLNKLNDEQTIYAAQIADKAKELGIPEPLAVAVAYHESGLNPRKIGGAKEIGLMQVLPSTGQMLGYKPEDLLDPAKNIEAGLTYLKQQLDKYGGAPELATLAYNRGPGVADRFISGQDDEAGRNYVKSVHALGGFAPAPQPTEPEEPEYPLKAEPPSATAQRQAQDIAGLTGAGVGGTYGLARYGFPVLKGAVKGAATGALQAVAREAAPAPIPAASGAPAAPGGLSAATGAVTPEIPQQGPLTEVAEPPRATGMGRGNVNYGVAFGLTPGEAEKAVNMGKGEGGVWDIKKKKAIGDQLMEKLYPGQFAQDVESGFYLPRDYEAEKLKIVEEAKAKQAAEQMALQSQQAAQKAAAEAATPLGKISQTFRNMMSSARNVAAPVGRVAGNVLMPLNLYSTGAEGMAAAQELQRPSPDYGLAALSGAGALGGLMSLSKRLSPYGLPISLGASSLRQGLEQLKQYQIPQEQMDVMMKQMRTAPPQPNWAGMMGVSGKR